jgi:hypothetical protein
MQKGGEMGMTKRERVIKGLEKCRRYECDDCTEKCASQFPGDCTAYDDFVDSALALLKAQEPRLVEPNDFENADDFNWLPAWCEERTGAGYWEMILPDALDEKDVRYWTGRPTQEQMEATPWQIQS